MLINSCPRLQSLTAELEKILRWAHRITADTKKMEEEIQGIRAGLSRTLYICTMQAALPNIPTGSNTFFNRHPNVKLKLLSLNSNEI